jgi:hypothetical protein
MKIGGMSPASRHHARVETLASADHVGGKYQSLDIMLGKTHQWVFLKVPTSRNHVGKKPINGYHSEHSSFLVSSSFKNETNHKHNFILSFKLV